MRDVLSRLRGGHVVYSVVSMLIVIACVGAGAIIWTSNPLAGAAVGLVVGILVYAFAFTRLNKYLYRRRFRERGLPLVFPLSVEFTDEALDYTVGDIREIAKWTAVTELFPSRGYWIFLAQGSTFFCPTALVRNEGRRARVCSNRSQPHEREGNCLQSRRRQLRQV